VGSILQFIIALPQILNLALQLIKVLESQFGKSWPKYVSELGDTFKALHESKTVEDKEAVAQRLAALASTWGK